MKKNALNILFLKDEDETTRRAFHQHNGVFLPVLQHEIVNIEELIRVLDVSTFDAVIFTSQRAVDALGGALKRVKQSWIHQAEIFAVAPKTAQSLMDLGSEYQDSSLQRVKWSENGNAVRLLPIVLASSAQRILFLSGDKRLDVLPDGLQHRHFEELMVYKTLPVKLDESKLPERVDWIVFYSPSGVDVAWNLSQRYPDAQLASIGPTTTRALQSRTSLGIAQASKPEAEALLTAMMHSF
jgi:uroporphyrinogen-III synthase